MILYENMAEYCKKSLSMDIENKNKKLLPILFLIKLYVPKDKMKKLADVGCEQQIALLC